MFLHLISILLLFSFSFAAQAKEIFNPDDLQIDLMHRYLASDPPDFQNKAHIRRDFELMKDVDVLRLRGYGHLSEYDSKRGGFYISTLSPNSYFKYQSVDYIFENTDYFYLWEVPEDKISFVTDRLDSQRNVALDIRTRPISASSSKRRKIHAQIVGVDIFSAKTKRQIYTIELPKDQYQEIMVADRSSEKIISPDNSLKAEINTEITKSRPNISPQLTSVKEGEYGGKVSAGLGKYIDFSVAITPSGIQVISDGLIEDCHYVIDPKTGESFISKAQGKKCDAEKFEIVSADENLTFKFASWEKPVSIPFLSGDMGDGWIENAPTVATMKGVSIGDDMPSKNSLVKGYGEIEYRGRLIEYQKSSIGISGRTSTNYFNNASYHHAYSPETSSNGSYSISFDDMGIYSINGTVFATVRYSEPPEKKSPRFDAVVNALQDNYGNPTIFDKSGVSHIYKWHFRPDGSLIEKTRTSPCELRSSKDKTAYSRNLLMSRQELRTSWIEFEAGQPPKIVTVNQGQELRVSSECGYTIHYHIRPTKSGLLDRLSAYMFAHDPVRTEIWKSRSKALSRNIEKNIQLQKTSREVEPDL